MPHQKAPPQPRLASDAKALADLAAALYPDNSYLQAEWVRAVGTVRGTSAGWLLDHRVQRVERKK